MMRYKNYLLLLLPLFAIGKCFSQAQRVGGYEYSIDIPWRMEPRGDNADYGKIPIQLTLNDLANRRQNPDCHFADKSLSVCNEWAPNKFLKMEVYEKSDAIYPQPVTGGQAMWELKKTFTINDLTEVESSIGYWSKGTAVGQKYSITDLSGVTHLICQPWKGDDCRDVEGEHVSNPFVVKNLEYIHRAASEWHATAHYKAENYTPGTYIELRVIAYFRGKEYESNDEKVIQNITDLRVYLGQPLPKFSKEWAYGDLHYHSQGTDNVGEAGYNYRGTRFAMNAMGLDWLYATDHASNSRQVNYINIDEWSGFWNNYVGISSLAFLDEPEYFALNDMSNARWEDHWYLLNGEKGNSLTSIAGVNKPGEAMADPRRLSGYSYYSTPQIFLGGEVDVIPEVLEGADYAGVISGSKMKLEDICKDIPIDESGVDVKAYLAEHSAYFSFDVDLNDNLGDTPSQEDKYICTKEQLVQLTEEGTELIKDVQGLEIAFARQHLVYLPSTRENQTAGVMSNTNDAGGASRPLSHVLHEMKGQGYAFLAHPTHLASGNGTNRLGPDIIPYSSNQLKEAFNSEVILGLEAWNEDSRIGSKVRSTTEWAGYMNSNDPYWNNWLTPVDKYSDGSVYWPYWQKRRWGNPTTISDINWDYLKFSSHMEEVFDGVLLWDYMNLWSIDKSKTESIEWLGPNKPRPVFLAGGSDAHGDFNHRRAGYAFGTASINDTAIGKPRNLVKVGHPAGESVANGEYNRPRAWSQEQVINGLVNGNFVVTDGPIVRVVVDVNRNGIIDEPDVPMGSYYEANSFDNDVDVIVQWKNSFEFGRVNRIDLVVGAFDNTNQQKGHLYTSKTNYLLDNLTDTEVFWGTMSEPLYTQYRDWLNKEQQAYWVNNSVWAKTPESALTIIPNLMVPNIGQRVVKLDRWSFPIVKHTLNKDKTLKYLGSNKPDRMFVRASVISNSGSYQKVRSTIGNACEAKTDKCQYRLGFSNPVYIGFE